MGIIDKLKRQFNEICDNKAMDASQKKEMLTRLKYESKKYKIDNMDEAIVGGFLGFAVGDALGVPVEFSSREDRRKKPVTEMIGYGTHRVAEGTFSDDTSLMIATADSIIDKKKINYDDMMKKFVAWERDGKYTVSGDVFDIGITTKRAITNYSSGRYSAERCGLIGERDNGNGSLMRILPIAYLLAASSFSQMEEKEIVDSVSGLTHAHEISRCGCRIYCDYIRELLKGKSKKEAYKEIVNKDYSFDYSKDTLDKYKRVLSGDILNLGEEEIKSGGFVVHTLEASLWATLNSNSYEEAVAKAVNLGGDTDTTGAVTGGVNGIIYGMNKIPTRWLSKLKKKDYIEDIALKYSNVLEKNKIFNDKAESISIEKRR